MNVERASFANCREQDVVSLVTKDGETILGSYLTQARMHFLSIKNPESALLNKVLGPFKDDDIVSIEIVKDRETILEERFERLRGDPLPGRDPVTRDDFEYRLTVLSKAVASSEGTRRDQLLRQFNDVADRISLARSKREWILAAGRYSLKTNKPPELADLWMADVASPSLMSRPRAQDFDPDPTLRRKRVTLPDEAIRDERSVPNVLRQMKAQGLKASIQLAGDPAWERAVIQIDLGPGRSMRHLAEARRGQSGKIEWSLRWGGNDSRPGLRKRFQSTRLEKYQTLKTIIDRVNGKAAPSNRIAGTR
jgi:hypothetical protein